MQVVAPDIELRFVDLPFSMGAIRIIKAHSYVADYSNLNYLYFSKYFSYSHALEDCIFNLTNVF